MKYSAITLAFIASVLAACNSMPNRYDNVEYMHLVYLNIAADNQEGCNRLESESLVFYAKVLSKYTANVTNKNISDIYNQLLSLTQELAQRENPRSKCSGPGCIRR
jgi:hypothetical protein